MSANQFFITTPDGYRLAARLYEPCGAARAVVLIVPAMGVKQAFYGALSAWLAGRGYEVVTFDLRGIGESAPASLRGFACDILTWTQRDCPALLAVAQARAGGRPIIWIGHSLGGQVLALTPGAEIVDAAVSVASGVGYWPENAYPLRLYSWLLWFAIAPIATALCGYFPGRALRMVGDLPAGVIRQWSRWCRHPDYAVGVEGVRDAYHRLGMPMLSLSFTDDEYMSAKNVARLHSFYENAERDMRRIAPVDVGLRRIGHFGFFRPEIGARLWPAVDE